MVIKTDRNESSLRESAIIKQWEMRKNDIILRKIEQAECATEKHRTSFGKIIHQTGWNSLPVIISV